MSDSRRSKRSRSPTAEEGSWECPMCTYRNPPEFFKCEMCECRKGTSTRKPRLNPQVVALQTAQQSFNTPPPAAIPSGSKKMKKNKSNDASSTCSSLEQERSGEEVMPASAASVPPKKEEVKEEPVHVTPPKSKPPHTISRESSRESSRDSSRPLRELRTEVTVNNVTVIITENRSTKPRRAAGRQDSSSTDGQECGGLAGEVC